MRESGAGVAVGGSSVGFGGTGVAVAGIVVGVAKAVAHATDSTRNNVMPVMLPN
jgi:hypothetical protein